MATESNRQISRTLVEKADLTVQNMIDSGGYLREDQALSFVDLTIKSSTLLALMTPKTLKAKKQEVDKLGFLSRITRRGQEGKSLPEGSRAKPDLGKIEIDTVTVKFQINVDDDTIEDNIEGDGLMEHIRRLAVERFTVDAEELALQGDVDSTDEFLSLQDGFIKQATSHPVDDGVSVLALTHFLHLVNALPDEYQRDKTALRYLMSPTLETKQRDLFAARLTNGGDAALTSAAPIPVYGIMPHVVPMMPTTLGGGTEQVILLTDPKNMVYGIWRKIQLEMQRDAQAGQNMIIGRARVGFRFFHEPAVAKVVKVKAA
jgi:hypothetical protein